MWLYRVSFGNGQGFLWKFDRVSFGNGQGFLWKWKGFPLEMDRVSLEMDRVSFGNGQGFLWKWKGVSCVGVQVFCVVELGSLCG